MPFEIVRNDITRMQVDAIVNTANPEPIVGSGTDYAVHQAAGPELLKARQAIGSIAPGHSVSTPAFGLPAKYVLHTVTPAWEDGSHREVELLRAAYDAALALADQLGCASVAFPLMATGNYAYPREIAMKTAISAFTDFLMGHDMTVYLVVFSDKSVQLAGSLFSGLKSYIDANYVAERAAEEYAAGYRDRRHRPASLAGASSVNALRRPAADARAEAARPTDLQGYLGMAECSFNEYVLDLLKERSEKDADVYHRAGMSRQLFNKIINKKIVRPQKNTVLQLAIGLQLDLAQTQKLLEKAGYALTRTSKSDLVVQYFIERKNYNMQEIDLALFDCGLPTFNKEDKDKD